MRDHRPPSQAFRPARSGPVNSMRRRALGILAALAGAAAMPARALGAAAPVIGIVVDDMGYRLADGLRALALPGPLAYSFLPHTPHASRLLAAARSAGKDVMLHLPMEAVSANHLLGPGAVRSAMTHAEFVDTLRAALASVPGAIGVNNHMGSLLTRDPERMAWVMQTLRDDGLYFVDSRTTALSVAAQVARDASVPVAERDVFLDNRPEERYVHGQFARLLDVASRHGDALGIVHPHGGSVAVLARELPRLDAAGVTLVPVPEILRRRAPPAPGLRPAALRR